MNHRRWILTLDKFEVMLRLKVAVERNRFIRRVAGAYEDSKLIPASAKSDHERRLKNILIDHYNTVMPYFVKTTRKQLKASGVRLESKAISNFESLLIEWATTEALRKAKLITDTNMDDVTDAITLGMSEGYTIQEIVKEIRSVSGLTPHRASVVARTETHNAATYASIQSVREVEQETGGKFLKRWIATNDSRTRDAHAAMIGSDAIPLNEKFYVGGEWMDRAGDSTASPENIIHCRCQIIFEEQ